MKNTVRALAVVILAVATVGCGSSGSTATTPSTTESAVTAPTTAGASTTPTSATPSGADHADFCDLLVDGAQKKAALQASIGSPDFKAKLDGVTASNSAIVAAAPSDVRDDFRTINELALSAIKALDPSLSPSDKAAMTQQVMAQRTKPEVEAAAKNARTWVETNCPNQARQILGG